MSALVQKNYRSIGRHLLFWFSYLLYNIINDGWTETDSWALCIYPQLATDMLIIIPVVYLNLYVLMPAFYSKRKYTAYICCLFLLLLAGALAKRFFAFSVWLPLDHLNNPATLHPTTFWILARIIKGLSMIFPVVAVTMMFKLMSNTYRQERRLRALEREKFKAEIGLLKEQINPHFFFNTLNSLYFLTIAGSPKSPELIMHLSKLMRYMLYETSTSQVLLKNELAHLENYIAIEQMRFGERLELSFQYSGEIAGQWITPLLLLPFVENAFKHGIENSGGWVTIDLKVIEKRLYLKVENSFVQLFGQQHHGIGLKNVKRRMELIYPSRHELSIKQDNNVYQVDLKIDL